MRANEFLTEGRNHPVIVVDVQPAYDRSFEDGRGVNDQFIDIIEFVNNQTGPVLMFANAEETGITEDTMDGITEYWDRVVCGDTDGPEEDGDWNYEWDEDEQDYVKKPCEDEINWSRFEVVDKGYGYMRAWMDSGVPENLIVKTIREMYRQKVTDSRMLFDGEGSQEYVDQMNEFLGTDEYEPLYDDSMSVEWTSVAQLKRFNGAYIVGGGRNECLREVELLMNAFNIKYKRIDSLVYG